MDKKVQLKKEINDNDNYISYFSYETINIKSIRVITSNKNPYIVRLNFQTLYFMIRTDFTDKLVTTHKGGRNQKGWDRYGNIFIYPEYDNFNNYYYFDINFYDTFRIRDLFIVRNIVNYEDRYTDIHIEYEEIKEDIFNHKLYDQVRSEYKKIYYLMIYTSENRIDADAQMNTDLKYVNKNENFKFEKNKNNIYKLTLFENDFIESLDWDIYNAETKNGKIYTVLSELPIINFPPNLSNYLI